MSEAVLEPVDDPTQPLALGLSQTQYDFVTCPARHCWLIGPQGEGKTYAAIAALFAHRERVGRPIRGALIRDTHINIKRNTIPSIEKAFPGVFEFHDGDKVMVTEGIECALLGMDNAKSLQKVQGGELDFASIEEPAPILTSGASIGISHDVFIYIVTRVRGGTTPKRVQITMNPSDENHWTSKEQDRPLEDTKIFHIRPGENKHLTEVDRAITKNAFRDRPDLYTRFVEGKRARTYAGLAITPEFNDDLHMARERLDPIPGVAGYRFYDGGLNPSMVTCQITPSGRLHIYDAVVGQNMGMRQMLELKAQRLFNTPRYAGKIAWRDIGDPSLDNREQSNSEHSAARVINDIWGGSASFERGEMLWEPRRESLHDALSRMVGGLPFVQISPHVTDGEEQHWIKGGLQGGYCYRIAPSGLILRDGPEKNLWCVDDQTEMLTLDGWKRHDALTVGESVYGYHLGEGVLKVTPLEAVHVFDDGPHDVWHYQNQSLDMMVTPQHKCLVSHKYNQGVRLVRADEMDTADSILRTASYEHQRKAWYSDAFVALCAWVFTEGTYGMGRSGAVTICQSASRNLPYCDDISALVARFGGRYVGERATEHGPMRIWQVSGEIADAIHAVMPDKIPSHAFIHRMTNKQRRLFLYEAIRGDGTWHREEGHLPTPTVMRRNRDFFRREQTPRLFQKKREAIDALQMIATLAGMRAYVRPKISGINRIHGWSLSLSRHGEGTTVCKLEKTVKQAAMVWCPQTALSTWVARRNGLVFLTGNSHPCDALTHGLAKLLRKPSFAPPPSNRAQVKRAGSYSVRAA